MEKDREQRGQSLVEFALLLPVLLIILAGVLDLGRLYYSYVAVTDAAGEGASYAAIHPPDPDGPSQDFTIAESAVVEHIQDATGGLLEGEDLTVEIGYPPDIQGGAAITVTVSYTYTVGTPIVSAIVPEGVLILRAVATEAILSGP
jgi:Flp pilus assembly protein TadG